MIVEGILIEVLAYVIIAGIIGAGSSFAILYRHVNKLRNDILLMKKATIIAFRIIVKDTKEFHGEDMTDIEKLYRDLIRSE